MSMREVLLDTDVLSEILKRKNEVVLERARRYSARHAAFTFSMVSVHEIVYGLIKKGAEQQLIEARRSFYDNRPILPTFGDFDRSGVVRGRAQRQGHTLTLADCLIGAVAERLGLPLATGNTAHFQAMVDAGLSIELENWRALRPSA